MNNMLSWLYIIFSSWVPLSSSDVLINCIKLHKEKFEPEIKTYFCIVSQGVAESQGCLRQEGTWAVGHHRGSSPDQRVMGEIFHLLKTQRHIDTCYLTDIIPYFICFYRINNMLS